MPYAVLPPLDRDQKQALADARWRALEQLRPETGAAIALQRQLIGTVLDLTASLEGSPPPRPMLPPRYLTTKLRSGIPAITGEPINVPVALLRVPLLALAKSLAATGSGAAEVHQAIESGRLDAGALLTLAARRDQAAIRAVSTRLGLGHDLVWLVADLATGPYAHWLLGILYDAAPVESALRGELDSWQRGYCPLCGSWPSFVETAAGVRRLRCSFCAAAWEPAAHRCVYCDAADDRLGLTAPDPAHPHRAVESCTACRGYVKRLEDSPSLPFPLLPLADFESMDLDMLAMQQGYGRPALKIFRGRG